MLLLALERPLEPSVRALPGLLAQELVKQQVGLARAL
jgi:hypothetical protein